MDGQMELFPVIRDEIDEFVDFLITETCEGCRECEPRSNCEFPIACVEEGRAKWLLAMAKRWKERNGRTNDMG